MGDYSSPGRNRRLERTVDLGDEPAFHGRGESVGMWWVLVGTNYTHHRAPILSILCAPKGRDHFPRQSEIGVPINRLETPNPIKTKGFPMV